MNKADLHVRLASTWHVSNLEAARRLAVVLDAIVFGSIADGAVVLSGFGTFKVKRHEARLGSNPHTGEPIQIAAGKRVSFRVGKTFKARAARNKETTQ